jgi:hypothetical protein
MKKIILSLVAILAFGSTNAQETKEVKKACAFKFGIKAGANYDWLATGSESVYDLRPEVGNHIGLLVEYKLCDKFAIQPEVLYSFSSYSFDGNGNKNNNKLEIREVAMPLIAKFYLIKGLSLEVGPQGSLVLNAEVDGVNNKDDFRKYNVAAVSGLAYDFGMGAFIQARYVYNFLDLQYDSAGNNRFGIQASLGYKF